MFEEIVLWQETSSYLYPCNTLQQIKQYIVNIMYNFQSLTVNFVKVVNKYGHIRVADPGILKGPWGHFSFSSNTMVIYMNMLMAIT